jgi:hypothetical protein
MKKLSLLLVLGLFVLGVKATEPTDTTLNFQTNTSLVLTWETSIINQTEFTVHDTINFDVSGSEDYELSKWYCVSPKELDGSENVILSYFQYKFNGKGVRYIRTIEILHEPKWVTERKIIN